MRRCPVWPGLEKLIIDKNQITEILSIGKLLSLKTLSLSGNKLSTLPEDLCQLRSLKKLAVHGNRLYELHSSIGLLAALETLDLRGNQLTYLPVSIGQLHSLKHLDIAENKLSQLVLSICDLQALERIDVKDNPLQAAAIILSKAGYYRDKAVLPGADQIRRDDLVLGACCVVGPW